MECHYRQQWYICNFQKWSMSLVGANRPPFYRNLHQQQLRRHAFGNLVGIFYWLSITPKNEPKVKKGGMKVKKWHWSWINTSFNRATTKIFSSTVSPALRASENVWLTWLLTSWSLFTGPFFYLKKSIFDPPIFFINFIRILWFIWGLRLELVDIHKDVVCRKIFVFW